MIIESNGFVIDAQLQADGDYGCWAHFEGDVFFFQVGVRWLREPEIGIYAQVTYLEINPPKTFEDAYKAVERAYFKALKLIPKFREATVTPTIISEYNITKMAGVQIFK